MAQTRAATKRIKSGIVPSNDGVLPQDLEPSPALGGVPKPPAKKRRTDGAEPSKNQRRGKPGELCQLNLDVLFLLAGYIHPKDLLNLARTCKSLRQLLMDKCSAFVWKAARPAGGLPACPADLTEPEYANLAFCARCHACGKYAATILWQMRRRYCPECKVGRLCSLYSCHEPIRTQNVLATEKLTIRKATTYWVDKEQMESFMQEYNHSSDKKQLLRDKRCQNVVVREHAYKCRSWQKAKESEHKSDLKLRRRERETRIFERLEQHGYGPEITLFGHHAVREAHQSIFKSSKLPTDKEWTRMWPEWLETMNKFRFKRLELTVYKPRRNQLLDEYINYVTSPSPNPTALDYLPHKTDLVHFPPFQDVIRAPDGTQMSDKPFESAFAQLPVLVDQWRKKFDVQLAELVNIPSHLSLQSPSYDRVAASNKTTCVESSQTTTDKLHLACAVFDTGSIVLYPEVLSAMHVRGDSGEDDSECHMSIQSRFLIRHMDGAPYIVHACGLDPNVATAEDMDRRNARLKCLSCKHQRIRSWRDAMWHARLCYPTGQASHNSARWEIISDEYIDAIQAAELSVKQELPPNYTRCLLCRPRVGDATNYEGTVCHLKSRHGVARDDIKLDVHYVNLGMRESCSVEMVEEGGQVTFKDPTFAVYPG